ncbi:MAG TPA: hypothetical protein VLM18_06215 [Croceibacterium sp.]|nr:hypothetical protein [Croceibacterium sp.]
MKAYAQHTVDQYFALNPDAAIYQGDHRFDGQLPDWSPAGLKAQADFLQKVIADADGHKGLGKDDAFERDYLVHVAEGQLFFLEEADRPHTNPRPAHPGDDAGTIQEAVHRRVLQG